MKEEWKPIRGYEGKYEISNLGRVYSVARSYGRYAGLLPLSFHKKMGYVRVCLRKKGKSTSVNVHTLVAKHFLKQEENYYGKYMVVHKNGNKTDNRVENLKVVARRNFTTRKRIPVIQLDLSGNVISQYKSMTEAAQMLNCNSTAICFCCKGKQKTARGYQWKYGKI